MATPLHETVMFVINGTFFWYFVALNTIYMIVLALAARQMSNYINTVSVESGLNLPDEFAKPFTVLVPAYNEEVHIVDSATALLDMDYPEHEVIICNDGSTDRTLAVLIDAFKLEKVDVQCSDASYDEKIRGVYFSPLNYRLMVVDKVNTGKADTLNAGSRFSRYPYLCAVDADSILSGDSMSRMMKDFVAIPGTVARGGVVRLSNGCDISKSEVRQIRIPDKMIEKIQVVEYFRAFLFGRMGFQKLDALLIISGAFGVFRRDVLDAVNGWMPEAVGEDMELVVKIQRYIRDRRMDAKVGYSPYPVCWTEAPSTLHQLGLQRDRWHRALSQCMMRHISLLFNPRYGSLGLIGYPYFFVFELLSAPIEFIGYPMVLAGYIMGTIDLPFFILFFAVALLWGTTISSFSLLLAETSFKRYRMKGAAFDLFVAAVCENFGYRQIHAYWRVRGMVKYFLFRDKGWSHLKRAGLAGAGIKKEAKE